MKTLRRPRAAVLCGLAALCALTVCLFLLLYRHDNKYTSPGPQALRGVLRITQEDLAATPVIWLVNGWAYYPGVLLTPEDLPGSAPAEYIFMGQYSGFEAAGGSPHGSASYALTILLPEAPAAYTLELPEIFSAYVLYVNGARAASMGEPEPAGYRGETGVRSVTVTASGSLSLLLAVSDFSHIYSGAVYPPAFGMESAVARVLSARLLLRGALCVAAAVVGLLTLLAGRKSGRLPRLYALLCLLFIAYTCYPITRTLWPGGRLGYLAESLSFCLLFPVVLLIQRRIAHIPRRRGTPLLALSALVCVVSAANLLLAGRGHLGLMLFFSGLLGLYKLVMALYITTEALWAARRPQPGPLPMLAGILVFDCALVLDRALPLYEPILSGWFVELGAAALVVAAGLTTAGQIARQVLEGHLLAERSAAMERLLDAQAVYYPMLREQIRQANTTEHDLKHHLLVIGQLAEEGAYEQLRHYVAQYSQSFPKGSQVSYSDNGVINVLMHHYAAQAEARGIRLGLRISMNPDPGVQDVDLCIVFCNLLQNALEGCARAAADSPGISLTALSRGTGLYLHMENSSPPALWDGGGLLSAKAPGRRGYGTASVAAIAEKYGGTAVFRYDSARGVFVSEVLLGSDL